MKYPWLVYSKYLDGSFSLSLCFGMECGKNGVKLDKLFQSPLTFWTAIRAKSQKFTNVLSISCRHYLKNYLRGTMGEERFNGLALMHAHRDIALNLDEIIDLLAFLHPRRKRMANSLCIDD